MFFHIFQRGGANKIGRTFLDAGTRIAEQVSESGDLKKSLEDVAKLTLKSNRRQHEVHRRLESSSDIVRVRVIDHSTTRFFPSHPEECH